MVMKMKKKLFIFLTISILFLTACDLGNTPTAQVEEYLSKYQRLEKNFDKEKEFLSTYLNLDKEKIEDKVIKRQYQNLTYEIKNEKIDGLDANVEVSIEVYDYAKILNNTKLTEEEKQDKIKKQKERINYTLKINLTKNKQNKWVLNSITKEEKEKLLGIYSK